MAQIETYPDGSPSPGDKFPYVEDPSGTALLKLVDVADLPGGGGAGSSFTKVIDEDGSSLANWSVITGTWAVAGGVIECQSSGVGQDLRLDTPSFDASDWVLDLDFQVADLNGYAGPGACYRSGTDITGSLELNFHLGTVIAVAHNVSAATDIPAAMAVDTWTALRVHFVGTMATIWLDGLPLGTVAMTDVPVGDQLMLRSYGTTSKWRNIVAWQADLALPA